MTNLPPDLPSPQPSTPPARVGVASRTARKTKGFFPPKVVRSVAFYIISLCIVASVVVCILAIWDFAQKDTLWRLIASFLVVAAGTALFAVVNGVFGEERDAA